MTGEPKHYLTSAKGRQSTWTNKSGLNSFRSHMPDFNDMYLHSRFYNLFLNFCIECHRTKSPHLDITINNLMYLESFPLLDVNV